eukprot:TRINITY_DN2505_c0_g1_i1.p1 TRINITY_DN2505_c0_g1~~TRINITY_DN2505_c0_g1_i1.p1  ORF type:complete len:647 (+),score=109.13 TRINITY_DN2505_c0_g1_i1:165-2105(+)
MAPRGADIVPFSPSKSSFRIVVLPMADAEIINDIVASVTSQGEEALSRDAVSFVLSQATRSSAHLWHFVDSLGKRLSNPSHWSVVLKGVLLLHELLRCGSQAVESDLIQMLLVDESSSGAGGEPHFNLRRLAASFHAAPTHGNPSATALAQILLAYSMFLLERANCAKTISLITWAKRPTAQGQTAKKEAGQDGQGGPFTPEYWREQSGEAVLTKVYALQDLLYALLKCQLAPELVCPPLLAGALELVLRDSFDLYSSINYALMELLERFDALPRKEAFQALEVYRVAAQQAEALAAVYQAFGAAAIGQGVSFPAVAVLDDAYLSSLEQIVSEGASQTPQPSNQLALAGKALVPFRQVTYAGTPAQQVEQHREAVRKQAVQAKASQQFDSTFRDLFATDRYPTSQPTPAYNSSSSQSALAVWQPAGGAKSQKPSWEAMLEASVSGQGAQQQSPVQWEAALASPQPITALIPHLPQPQLPGGFDQLLLDSMYEAALASPQPITALIPHLPQPQLPGGFDQLLLDSMYEAAEAQRRAQHAASNPGLAGMHSLGGGMAGPTSRGPDPFGPSSSVPPPPYVQMALRAQQQMAGLLQQRMMAQHSQYSARMQGAIVPASVQQQAGLPGPFNNCRNPDNVGVMYNGVLVPYS